MSVQGLWQWLTETDDSGNMPDGERNWQTFIDDAVKQFVTEPDAITLRGLAEGSTNLEELTRELSEDPSH